MSWNPSPIYGNAQWNGNQQLATRKQLISSINGIYTDLQDLSGFDFQNLTVSTLTVKNWLSVPTLYVSSLYATNIDLSGIVLDPSGVFIISDLSANQCSISFVSLSTLQFNYTMNNNLNVSFDLGLGEAVGGALAGLGALVGGAFIGAGIAIGGTAQGIATLIAGRPQNYITNNNYETINFTSQLQVSTIGYADPIYSTIFRTVSSISADQVPGREIFTSSFFYPGQICIRTVSDPFNIISADPNLNTSTIQSFGQWTPLIGLEPENIVANGVVANTISTGNFYATLAKTAVLESYTVVASNFGVGLSASFDYQAPLTFQTGATNQAAFVGNLNRLICYNDTGYIFTSRPDLNQENASLYLGNNANQSLLTVSSIQSEGFIQANAGFFSTLTVQSLTVISTINTQSTNVENITSTATLYANTAYIDTAFISSLDSFSFIPGVGNPTGPYDITKTYSLFSTSYSGVSSLTHNILNYQMNLQLQDQTSFNLNIAETNFGINYVLNPQNVGQWGSTLMIFNDYQNPGDIDIAGFNVFSTIGLTGTFDVQSQYNPVSPGYVDNFYVAQRNIGTIGYASTIFQVITQNTPPPQQLFYTRFVIGPDGYCRPTQSNPAPYETQNSNIFTITQDINDVTIQTTDRLNLKAGEIFFEGSINLNNINVNNLNANNLITNSTTTTYLSEFIQTNSTWGPSSTPPNMIELDYTANIGFVSSLASTNTQIMTNAQAGYINNYVSQISTLVNRPYYNLSFGTANQLFLGPLGATGINGGPGVYNRPDINWAFGSIVFTAADSNFTINIANYGSIATNGQILNLSNAGSFNATLTVQGVAGTTLLAPGVGCSIKWNSTVFLPPQPFTAWPPYAITDQFAINQSFGSVEFDTNAAFFTGSVVVNSNAVVDGSLRTVGPITTYTPSGGYAGIEVSQYNDTMIWSLVGGSGATWESAALNPIPRPGGGYYNSTDWVGFISPIAWDTPDYSSQLNGWTTYITNTTVGGVQVLALYRLLTLIHVGGPSAGNFKVQIMMIPNNLTTNS